MAIAEASTSKLPEQRRLYVGNLSDTVDEYMLTKLFNKYGRITKLDFLFHTAGPLKGRPRGYAFVELETAEQASIAITETNNKLLRGKRIAVSLADQPSATAPTNSNAFVYVTDAQGQRRRVRKSQAEVSRQTPLSLLKTGSNPSSTDAKIKALEEKLNSLKKSAKDGAPLLEPPTGHDESPTSIRIPEGVSLPAKPDYLPGAFDSQSGVGTEARQREGTLAQSAEVLRLAQAKTR